MKNTLIAGVTALSLALTSLTAAPAAADDRDIGRVLAGIAAIAIIGAAIDANNNRPPEPAYHGGNDRQRLLPAICLQTFETRRGPVRLYGQRCLQENFRAVRFLPQACLTTVRTYRGHRTGYEPRCLRDAGFRGDDRGGHGGGYGGGYGGGHGDHNW